jgi:hypothetical protein
MSGTAGSGAGPHARGGGRRPGGGRAAALGLALGLALALQGCIVIGPGPGGGPHVRVFSFESGQPVPFGPGFFAYDPLFTGGVHVAVGRLGSSNFPEIITGPGPGGAPLVRAFRFDQPTLTFVPVAAFLAYGGGFAGGVAVAAGDLDNDGRSEIVTAPGPGGGAHVRVFKVNTVTGVAALFAEFLAFPLPFAGGAWVAAGDIDGDDRAEIVVGSGPGGPARVRYFKVSNAGIVTAFGAEIQPYPGQTGGVRVAVADFDDTAGVQLEVITAPGPTGPPPGIASTPFVRLFKVSAAGVTSAFGPGFLAYGAAFAGGVFVGASNIDGNISTPEVITTPGAGGGPHVRTWRIDSATGVATLGPEFLAYPPAFTGGLAVSGTGVN